VEDADPWWQHIQRVGFARKYPDIVCKPPEMQPWWVRVLYRSDPTGILWHISDPRKPYRIAASQPNASLGKVVSQIRPEWFVHRPENIHGALSRNALIACR